MKRFVDEIVVHDFRLAEDIAKCLIGMKNTIDTCYYDVEIYEGTTYMDTRNGTVTRYEEPVTVLKIFSVEK
jgi:hypothetical protein